MESGRRSEMGDDAPLSRVPPPSALCRGDGLWLLLPALRLPAPRRGNAPVRLPSLVPRRAAPGSVRSSQPIPGPPTNPFEVALEGTSSEVGYGGTVLLNCSTSCRDAGAPGGLETSLSKDSSQPIPGPPTNPFEVALEGTSSEVGYGGTVLLNCSTSCRDAGAPGGLETSLSKEWVGRGPGWLSIRLRNITEPLSDIICYVSCFGERKVVTFTVLAYELPQPHLAISNPNASCNETVAIACSSVPSWPPGLKLWLRSSRRPLQPWAEGPVHLELTAGEDDDGTEFSCEAQLSVGNRTLRKSSATDMLGVMYHDPDVVVPVLVVVLAVAALLTGLTVYRIYYRKKKIRQYLLQERHRRLAPPRSGQGRAGIPAPTLVRGRHRCPPGSSASSPEPAGTAANASCRIAGAFPAGDVRFSITLAEQSLNFTVTATGDVLTAVTVLSTSTPGQQELTCTATVATAARTARTWLHVYRFPAPVLELSPASAPAGSEVTVACRAGVADPPAVRLQLRDADGGVLAEGPQARLELRLVARREDDGRQFGCRASLAIADGMVTKDTDTRLAVLYKPEMAASDCPSNRTWLRGTREALSCRATGNPAPTVVCGRDGGAGRTRGAGWEPACRADGAPPPSPRCARDGGAHRTRGSRAVSRADAGRYICRATNKHGSAVRSVVVTVEYEPSIGEMGCPARRLWVEGTPAELACAASGNPPPHVACAKLGDGQDPPPASPNVTRAHAGTYQCRATNTHGSALRNVTVAVE
ncbi:PREDICTED: intercellular adhesion molecule 5-like, partial [Nipponia nippon]|uniref:intercellular adhesion molecule 5-like n=1 Tax=Nipponia nippon TaxID=128390 RepID=UPI000510B7CC